MSISVLISAYINCTKDNIEKALNSIFHEQVLKPDQIVLVLDGPVGDSLYEFVLLFQKSVECEMIIHPIQKSKGFGNALNEGLKLCTGEYIARMDSDDISFPRRFEKQINLFNKWTELDALGTGAIIIDEVGNVKAKKKFPSNIIINIVGNIMIELNNLFLNSTDIR